MHGRYGSAPRRGKDRLLLKNSSNGAVNAPLKFSDKENFNGTKAAPGAKSTLA
jgi:hypothetical protein